MNKKQTEKLIGLKTGFSFFHGNTLQKKMRENLVPKHLTKFLREILFADF